MPLKCQSMGWDTGGKVCLEQFSDFSERLAIPYKGHNSTLKVRWLTSFSSTIICWKPVTDWSFFHGFISTINSRSNKKSQNWFYHYSFRLFSGFSSIPSCISLTFSVQHECCHAWARCRRDSSRSFLWGVDCGLEGLHMLDELLKILLFWTAMRRQLFLNFLYILELFSHIPSVVLSLLCVRTQLC